MANTNTPDHEVVKNVIASAIIILSAAFIITNIYDYLYKFSHTKSEIILTEEEQRAQLANKYYNEALDCNVDENLGKQERIELYTKAAELNHAEAQFNLGINLQEEGREDEALYWWKRATELGEYNANINLGNHHRDEGNWKEATILYEQAARAGSIHATLQLLHLAYRTNNEDQTMYWLEQLAKDSFANTSVKDPTLQKKHAAYYDRIQKRFNDNIIYLYEMYKYKGQGKKAEDLKNRFSTYGFDILAGIEEKKKRIKAKKEE